MRSVGETMAIGRTFNESFQKALRGLENKQYGFGFNPHQKDVSLKELLILLKEPNPNRIIYIEQAFRQGMIVEQLFEYTKISTRSQYFACYARRFKAACTMPLFDIYVLFFKS